MKAPSQLTLIRLTSDSENVVVLDPNDIRQTKTENDGKLCLLWNLTSIRHQMRFCAKLQYKSCKYFKIDTNIRCF